ncbi:MAG: pantoate--beta-alanine ligase [Rhodospirillales bacterium]|nr:pantoate--beta-alanine ligase [Rhodospirillales bacterium]MDE0381319.1 pantoate--beta-alanine ligase [Rhodospirillales bacterium]
MAPSLLDSVDGLRGAVAAWRADGLTVALVPTMGALHEGHMALVRAARTLGERTVVSLFVNPAQFAPDEDFDLYPRNPADDLAKLAEAGVEAAFMPNVDAIYPPGFATTVHVEGVTAGLESAARPHFFDGVATVVTKLLLQCLPDVALFGEKDYQQLVTVRRLVADLDIPCQIEAVPTVRAEDGLALSSRNVYLSAEERRVAPRLFEVLSWMAAALAQGAPSADAVSNGRAALTAAGFTRIDYLAVCDAETLASVEGISAPARVLAAAWLGETRLIDNVVVNPVG